jgi:hypothetical protein
MPDEEFLAGGGGLRKEVRGGRGQGERERAGRGGAEEEGVNGGERSGRYMCI